MERTDTSRTTITARDLTRNTAEIMARVAAGETIEVTRNGIPVAIISPPDPQKAVLERLIKQGIVEPDWHEKQMKLIAELRTTWRPLAPGEKPLSETLIEMREEETR